MKRISFLAQTSIDRINFEEIETCNKTLRVALVVVKLAVVAGKLDTNFLFFAKEFRKTLVRAAQQTLSSFATQQQQQQQHSVPVKSLKRLKKVLKIKQQLQNCNAVAACHSTGAAKIRMLAGGGGGGGCVGGGCAGATMRRPRGADSLAGALTLAIIYSLNSVGQITLASASNAQPLQAAQLANKWPVAPVSGAASNLHTTVASEPKLLDLLNRQQREFINKNVNGGLAATAAAVEARHSNWIPLERSASIAPPATSGQQQLAQAASSQSASTAMLARPSLQVQDNNNNDNNGNNGNNGNGNRANLGQQAKRKVKASGDYGDDSDEDDDGDYGEEEKQARRPLATGAKRQSGGDVASLESRQSAGNSYSLPQAPPDGAEPDGDEQRSPFSTKRAGRLDAASGSYAQAPPRMLNNNANDEHEPLGDENAPRADESNQGDSDDGQAESGRDSGDSEAAARREQEAAEASEAETADRSALAEQQQMQRDIIKAQALSEARAIRDQQEALLKQQQLQQQMLMRRNQNYNIEGNNNGDSRLTQAPSSEQQARTNNAVAEKRRRLQKQMHPDNERIPPNQPRQFVKSGHFSASPHYRHRNENENENAHHYEQHEHLPRHNQFIPNELGGLDEAQSDNLQLRRPQRLQKQVDNQFSDQPDNGIVDRGTSSSARAPRDRAGNLNEQHRARPLPLAEVADELGGEYSMRSSRFEASRRQDSGDQRGLVSKPKAASASQAPELRSNDSRDLLAAAQTEHNYGVHYGSLIGHLSGGFGLHNKHSNKHHYNQFVESPMKGHFKSGFKRGNRKFLIESRAQQHKDNAEGFTKWRSKKGKGSHHWDLKHKNKKHYGSGHEHSNAGLYHYY